MNGPSDKYSQKSRIAVRVRNMNMILLVLVLVLITITTTVLVTDVTGSASKNLARFYSIESVDKFDAYISQDLALVRKVAHSKAVTGWFADEENEEKRIEAYNEMMDYASLLQSAELYFGIEESRNEFSIGSGATLEDFVPGDKLTASDPINAWYFECIASENDYVLNIDIDKFSNRWRLWINHKVTVDGKIVGVFCSGLRINTVLRNMFAQYNANNVKGYVIDRNGAIQMDSTNYNLHSEGVERRIRDAYSDPVFTAAIDSYLENIHGFFSGDLEPKIMKLSAGSYGYV